MLSGYSSVMGDAGAGAAAAVPHVLSIRVRHSTREVSATFSSDFLLG